MSSRMAQATVRASVKKQTKAVGVAQAVEHLPSKLGLNHPEFNPSVPLKQRNKQIQKGRCTQVARNRMNRDFLE
jgi:hypothetical protein